MLYRINIFLAILFFTACSSPELSSKQTKSSTMELVNPLESIDEKIMNWQRALNIPNVGLGIIENGQLVKSKVYGKFPKGNDAPLNALFNIASITKVETAMICLKLIEAGDWSLDEPLSKYYIDPEVASDPRALKISTRHILSQQSGFANWRWNHPTEKLTFEFEPGTRFQYSGEGMEYLRIAMENKFGESYSQLAERLLFNPLKMKDARNQWDGILDLERFCLWYDTEGKKHLIEDFTTVDNAADDLMCTVDDLAKFGIDVMKGAGLSNSLYNDMIKTQVNINANLQQGLGWRVVNNLPNGEYALQHGGNDIGVASLLVLLPDSKRGLIIFTNADNGLLMCNNIVREVWPEGKEIIQKSYKSIPIDQLEVPIRLSVPTLEKYTGKFTQPSGRPVEIIRKDDHLQLIMPGAPLLNFLPKGEDHFFLLDFDAELAFEKNQLGEIQTAILIDGNNEIKCEKQ